jgi:hypothetical protein
MAGKSSTGSARMSDLSILKEASLNNINSAPESETDLGNAKRFKNRNNDKCFYHENNGRWFQWNDKVWTSTGQENINKLAQDTAIEIFDEAWRNTNLANWAKASCSRSRLSAMVELAIRT